MIPQYPKSHRTNLILILRYDSSGWCPAHHKTSTHTGNIENSGLSGIRTPSSKVRVSKILPIILTVRPTQ
jgi:hypothetical protein